MRWVTAVSVEENAQGAVDEVVSSIRAQLPVPDVVMVFPSRHFAAIYGRIATGIAAAFEGSTVVGCAASGVLSQSTELESGAGLVVMAAELPDVQIQTLELRQITAFDTDEMWRERLKGAGPDDVLILFADNFSCDINSLLSNIDRVAGSQVCGALSSAGLVPGQNAMILGPEILRNGAVGLLLKGNIKMTSLVAQGCRPIGPLFRVKRASGSVVTEFDQGTPATALNDLYASLPRADQQLIPQSLVVGVVQSPDGLPSRTDFLIRHVAAIDPNSGALSVDQKIDEGAYIQFHLRDGSAAKEDLDIWLEGFSKLGLNAEGALLFSCIGRGERFLGEPSHDSKKFLSVADMPLAGFFGAGEIGPVAGETHLHAYTSMFAVFSEA